MDAIRLVTLRKIVPNSTTNKTHREYHQHGRGMMHFRDGMLLVSIKEIGVVVAVEIRVKKLIIDIYYVKINEYLNDISIIISLR